MQETKLKSNDGVCHQQTHDKSKNGSPQHLAEGVTQHGLQIFRGELAFSVDVTEDSAPLVDDLGLLARRPPDAHGIVDDYRCKGGGYGEVYSPDALGEADAGHQCNDSGGMA